MTESPIAHCVTKIVELSARAPLTPRDLLQLGYNLGRLSELTGLGRAAFWDRWKDAVAVGDGEAIRRLGERLHEEAGAWDRTEGA